MDLIINTRYPETVRGLMLRLDLVEKHQVSLSAPDEVAIEYGSDAISQELAFWFALAQGSRLIEHYTEHNNH